jgi:pimeloyl-ACP methyl ester carboxylesterase
MEPVKQVPFAGHRMQGTLPALTAAALEIDVAQKAWVKTSVLDVVYEHSGPRDGFPVVLLHGYPYDVRAFDEVVPLLNAAGLRTITPYLRGYGGTRFLLPETPRSGEQAALGQDLLELLDVLQIGRAVLGGFDWGARAACVVSALWPQRVTGLVTCAGYLIQDIANSDKPLDFDQEQRYWYQYYFHTKRGRNGLMERRAELGELLWKLWSPTWTFETETFQRTAASFENKDFIDVVLHSYRHRTGEAPGDPRYADIEARLTQQPKISASTIVIHGEDDGVVPCWKSENHHQYFTGSYERRMLPNVGHNPPQEAPGDFAQAIIDVGDQNCG